MTKLIGWTFVLMCPFFGTPWLVGMLVDKTLGYPWEAVGTVIMLVWGVLFCLWFDDSKYQRSLMK